MAASSSSALVSSSPTPSLGPFTYEVFLSFRGVETRQGFTWNLYQFLQDAGIKTFMDEKDIEAGEEIDERLLKAIGDSRYCVVILSSRYAESKTCLMELATMFRLKKEIIPVFFYVEPSNVSHQSGPFENAFSTHQKHSNSSRYVEEWREAMTKVGQLKGFHHNHQSNKKEVELIQEIVKRVGGCSDIVMLPVAAHPVGLEFRVEEVMELLSIGERGVKMVGIYGMGGIGKTTLAKEIHNRLQCRFEKAIYIEGIKDKKDRLPKLQEEFISKAFKDGNKKISNPSEGSAEIKRRFPRKSVLAVLDDVDDGDQLKALAGGCDWFGEGTRILITTRDEQLLDAHRHVAKKYQVPELNSRESLRLFSCHAFNSDQPSEEFMAISTKIAKAAGGHPLAVEVLGSFLSTERDKEAWEEVETKLRSSGYSKIDKCLRISYDGLSQNEQEGFLDIACFFLGEEKDVVIDLWKGRNFHAPVSTVNSLLHKCLLKVDDFGRLRMHDLLRDMGRVIDLRSRLWDQKKVWDILQEYKGTDQIKGIICKEYMKGEEESFDAVHSLVDVEAFANMSNLQLLLLENINLKGDFSKMPRSLRSLKWTGCSMQTLPDNFNIQKLGCLKLYSCEIVQFWSYTCISKQKVFTNLKVLDLRDCSALKKLPDFSHFLDLEKLCLRGCRSLTHVPESIGRLSKLEHLVLRSCSTLSRLPNSIEELTGLRKLEVSSCRSLLALPNSIESFTRLEELSLRSWTSFSTLPHFVENLTSLRCLDVSQCEWLMALPNSIENLSELQELRLSYCRSLSTLPNSIGKLTRLKRLKLDSCKSLSALPDSIGNLTELEELVLPECTSLPTMPESIGNLTKLGKLDVYSCESLSALPNSIGNLTRLEYLDLASCKSLSTLPDSIGNLTRLEYLGLAWCTSLSMLPDSIENLIRLKSLRLCYCESLLTLPYSIGNLTGLEELNLTSCRSLSTLPSSMGNMRRLSTLVLNNSGIEKRPDSMRLLEPLERSSKQEAEWRQEIVRRVGGRSDNQMLHVTKHPVGIDFQVEEVMELLSFGEGGVKMVGIYGMGGVGKTTLAKEIYNRIQGRFDKAIYIEGIRDGVKKDGLAKLKQQFISKAFEKIKIHNLSEGSGEIKRIFCRTKVLAVLDDVDHVDQLKALAGGCDWFGEGTRILITTRDVQLLDAHRHVAKTYQVHDLVERESLHLFSRHAFNSDQPSEEFMEISKNVVKAAGGLPLALEVLGSFLSTERNKEAWEEVETSLRRPRYPEIDKCLRNSYDGLSQSEQEGFLDIACFFVGQNKDEVVDILKGCDFDAPVLTVNSLLHKCLVDVDDFGTLHMHDLLRDMGRDIGSHSRLWDQKEVWNVLEEHKGTSEIKGIICEGHLEGEGESFDAVHSLVPLERESVDVEAFANMPNLQLLLLENIKLKGDFSRMPRSLRSLKWTGCSMQMLPDNFNIEKLGCLKLHSSTIVQFWSDSCISKQKVFTNLKVLDLRDCSALTKLPDFSHSLVLEKLCLRGCSSLMDIPESIGMLRKLEHLELHSCSSLSSLPDSIKKLTGLRKLEVSSCRSLLALPNSIESLTKLEELSLRSWTSFSTLPHFVENLTRLRCLDVSQCEPLSSLPNSIENLTELQELRLSFCKSLSTLPNSIGKLTRLKRLMLNSCESLSALPHSFGNLTELEDLQLGSCASLSTLPDSFGNLTGLRKLDLSNCASLSVLPYSIRMLTVLEELQLGSSEFPLGI